MHLSSLLLCLSLGALVKCAAESEWCYTRCEHTPSHWGDISGAFCGEKRQSPINIDTHYVQIDPHLQNFTFVSFSSPNAIEYITNNGHTVKCVLKDNEVEVSGGGLNGTYSTIQFHFHWGDTEYQPGSEHTIDGQRYPMEMHIVSLKKGLNVTQAKADPEGLAVLGFFINATDDEDTSEAWSKLTSTITQEIDTEVPVSHDISINDLIGNVDLTKFYRYMGSLTTPMCNEAVVWTIFQEPIIINKNLIRHFSMKTGFSDVYRPIQNTNGRPVFASPATSPPWCYDDHCFYNQSFWPVLPNSSCAGERQSPINIETEKAEVDEHLVNFAFKKFDDKHAFKYCTNTGHTVKCVLKDGVVEVSEGGLGYVYSTLQLHFHWGMSHNSDGSEHTMNSKRFPMEMHIVNKRKDLTLDEAKQTPTGLAVLGFFIEPTVDQKSSSGGHSGGSSGGHSGGSSGGSSGHQETPSTSDMDAWKKLTNYFSALQKISSKVNVTEEISIDDLLGKVNRAAYYRYNGSLTTPTCDEVVVWTVFKESVRMDNNLMVKFPQYAGYQNVFRSTQSLHSRKVYTTKSASSASGPIIRVLLLASLCALFI
ncbi:carbonic anhydrase 4-like [Plectropomus leopardus]|uniref:carbonic anhydrase 4-like n=1 Tax=Plectropomus leopardus TaxID=160734 RepID=UPI001C4D507F|nr:carbonic anhydrase 4-like [Plectropomus leopardus]